MSESLKNFRDELQDSLLTLLWQQWCVCGVQGNARETAPWCIDPEILILLTCSIGRREPRMFDEMLDLLKSMQGIVNLQRLKTIVRTGSFGGKSVLPAVAGYLDKILKTKIWTNAIKKDPESAASPAPLFFFKDGRVMESFGKTDPIFEENGILCGPIVLRGLVGPFDLRHPACMLLRLRSFLGATSRSGICLYLCTHPNSQGENPSRIAKETGHAQRAVQNSLVSMSKSGYITRREHARDTLYAIRPEMKRALTQDLKAEPLWCNWITIGGLLEKMWVVFDSKKFLEADPIVQSVTLRGIVDEYKNSLPESGLPVTLDLQGHLEGEEYVEWVVGKVKTMLDVLIVGL
jgi:DNA-binding MarR family transcriptional regulator